MNNAIIVPFRAKNNSLFGFKNQNHPLKSRLKIGWVYSYSLLCWIYTDGSDPTCYPFDRVRAHLRGQTPLCSSKASAKVQQIIQDAKHIGQKIAELFFKKSSVRGN